MRRVDIDGGSYYEASDCLQSGNMWSAHYYGLLGDAVADTGAMAGDSSFAEQFATAYDEAARAATTTFDSLVTSYANLAGYTYASLENHTRAEQASTYRGIFITDRPSLLASARYDVVPIEVPSSLGGDLSSMPDWANWVLDRIEGFIWPDADLERLHAAGTAWRTTSEQLGLVADYADLGASSLSRIRSTEIPLAMSSLDQLAAATRELATQCTSIGDSCDNYANAVEEQREAIINLLHDLLRDAVIIQGLGFLAGLVSFGTANAGATYLNIMKVGAEAPKFRAMIELIRLYSIEARLALNASSAATVALDLRLRRFVEARVAFTTKARIVQDGPTWNRLSAAIRNPKTFDPNMLRGTSPGDLRRLVDGWKSVPAKRGVGTVYLDPVHKGRQVRMMQGYPGNRPDSLTHGFYVVVSQNGRQFKVPMEGNPTL